MEELTDSTEQQPPSQGTTLSLSLCLSASLPLCLSVLSSMRHIAHHCCLLAAVFAMGVFVLVFGSSLKTLQCGYDGYAQLPCPASSAQPPRCREMLHVLWWYLLLVRLQLAVSESCDSSDGGSESSFVALPPRTRRCLAANFKFPDLKRLAESGDGRQSLPPFCFLKVVILPDDSPL